MCSLLSLNKYQLTAKLVLLIPYIQTYSCKQAKQRVYSCIIACYLLFSIRTVNLLLPSPVFPLSFLILNCDVFINYKISVFITKISIILK